MQNIYEQVDNNKNTSLLVVAGFVGFITAAVFVMSYAFDFDMTFGIAAFAMSAIGSLISFYFSDQIILTMSGAKEVDRKTYFNFYTVTENLCLAAQLPMPKLYVIEDTAMNAFATGRDPNHAVVCATTGLIERLNRTELEGVVAHELSHIKNYDIRLMSVVTILVGTITLMADWMLRSSWGSRSRGEGKNEGQLKFILLVFGFLLALLSPIIANLIKLAISRRREYLADAQAVLITKFPKGLSDALEKISQDAEPLEAANKATAHLYIANPLKNHHDSIGWFAGMFSTHPPIEERIAALKNMY